MLWELRGVSCLEFEELAAKKALSNPALLDELSWMKEFAEAIAAHVNTACIKLREQNSCAKAICVYLEAQIEPRERMRCYFSKVEMLLQASNNTMGMTAKRGLSKIFQSRRHYKKCGVILLDLLLEKESVLDLFLEPPIPNEPL